MPWLWVMVLGLVGIGVFNLGANFLLSVRWLGVPLLWLGACAALMGQRALAVGIVGGGALWASTVLYAVTQGQRDAVVPRRQIWWGVVVIVVALLAVVATAANGRMSQIESWALLILGCASYALSPRTGERLVWWRGVVGLLLCGVGGVLTVWAMPTVGAVLGCSPLLVGTGLAGCCLISTTVWLWRQRAKTPAVLLTKAVGDMVTGLLTVGLGLSGIVGGAWTVSATTLWLTLPCLALTLVTSLLPLLLRKKTTRVGGLLSLVIYAGYWLLLWL